MGISKSMFVALAINRTLVKVVNGGGCVDAAVPDDLTALHKDREVKEKEFHLVSWS